MAVLNADCDAGFYYAETLGDLRTDLMVRLGYAAQARNIPPGMKALLDSFLQRSQNQLYRRLQGTHGELERFYTWQMVEGERFYGLLGNEDDCSKRLRRDQITGAWLEDLNGMWVPMAYGIDPAYFSMLVRPGIPARYEIRQNIEVFPAPNKPYKMHFKGRFGLRRFEEDDDPCSIDPDLLFLWALARAKNHYQQADANDTAAEAQTLLRDVISAAHQTARYIPRTNLPAPLTAPRFLGLEG